MLRNYLLIAWRNLLKNRIYSIINIAGLALGMAVALLIGLWLWDEVSFDHYHKNHGRIAEVLSVSTLNNEITVGHSASVPVASALKNGFPADFKNLALVSAGSHVFVFADKSISSWGMWAQPAFTNMFTINLVSGSRRALEDPSAILISQSFSKAVFGDGDPLNKSVKMDGNTVMKVGGVYADFPENTSFAGTECMMAWDNKDNRGTTDDADWYDHHFQLFVQVGDHTSFDNASVKIKDITKPHLHGGFEQLALQSMDKWHLYNEFRNGKNSGGAIQFVWLFGFAGLSVLLLACINFMNLATARSERRAREVGIRKAIGSLRIQLVLQFLGESFVMVLLSFVLSVCFVLLLLPTFNGLAGKHLFVPWNNFYFWFSTASFVLFTALVSGSYPAFYLSGFDPVKILKGSFHAGRWASLPRRILVVVQFTVSVSLILGTLVVLKQVNYSKTRPVGYSREGLFTVNISSPQMATHFDALRNELMQTGAIENMAESSSPSTAVENSMVGYDWKGRDPRSVAVIGTLFISLDFGKTIGWEIKDGRDFSTAFATDSGAYIINKAAAKYLGFRHPVGEIIRWRQADHPIIGVVKDMVMESPYMPVQPTFFTLLNDRRIHVISIRIKPKMPVRQALSKIETVFHKYDPENPFEYQFTDQAYAFKFYAEEHVGQLASFFAVLALFISCLGLFGLASFVAEQRTREIGVRKILGASVVSLWKLMSKEFAALVILSFLISAPFTYYLLSQWLQHYAYRTDISWWIFVAVGAGVLLITLLTVSYQAIRAARINPVKSLRTT